MKITLGPGAIVAAAFIGPGTIATAAAAGESSGITLLWAVLLSVLATLVLQELSVRSALATNRDLASLIRLLGERQWWSGALAILVLSARHRCRQRGLSIWQPVGCRFGSERVITGSLCFRGHRQQPGVGEPYFARPLSCFRTCLSDLGRVDGLPLYWARGVLPA